MIKVGVIGVGHIGRMHLQQLQGLTEYYEVVGFYDQSKERSVVVEQETQVKAASTIEELMAGVEALVIATPTSSHFSIAAQAIRQGKHVFIEKPICATLEQARGICDLAFEAGVKVQVGQVERYNPAFLVLQKTQELAPMFIEAHRLATWKPRGVDVSVVLDLMIHDIDLVLSIVKSGIKRIHANGVAVVSNSIDIANARLDFFNGCVANLTASRISLKPMRKMRFFQRNAYITLDFLEKKVDIITISETPPSSPQNEVISYDLNGITKYLFTTSLSVPSTNAIAEELKDFALCIARNTEPKISAHEATAALEVALEIVERIAQLQEVE
ncbi:MAG: Gfo/Idh/MocA family oxidoreductase [Bacteroidia bacterium]|nr:Gfo/Idh/MocA family oxidoreductase [Bacteroidia bacterium]MDW8158462.1 Gfo/Idh/MocA family oxidoreductase [Bacteroidia bacterium]